APPVCALPPFPPSNAPPSPHQNLRYPSLALKTEFLGRALLRTESDRFRRDLSTAGRFPVTRAGAVKRRKELPFDNVIQKDKKLKLVLKIRRILMSQPDRVMSLRHLGRFRKALGLQRRRRFIALLRRFPAVFEIVEEGAYSLRFKLTPEAERLYLEEMRIRNEMEALLVLKLRKLLMMSIDKRILLEKISHLRTDLGLPLEFRDTICSRYPHYFKVIPTGRGPSLELSHWDPDLAVSAAELAEDENKRREVEERNLIIDRTPRFKVVRLPKGLHLSRGEMRRIGEFRDMPYVSPYSDFSQLKSGTAEKEKHACGVVHELLSLTVEKRTLVDHLTHFRDEFRFSQQLRGMLIRHPDLFYVSEKGDRDSVFLREAYQDSQLVEKDRLLLIKEKLRGLVNVPRFGSRRAASNTTGGVIDDADHRSGDEEEEDEWDDIDDDDDGDGDDDEWSDDGDEVPPGMSESEDEILPRFEEVIDGEEKKVVTAAGPVFPHGRQRERW
ncbi:hypothetical protein M569_07372, partial [Genlisea aurea]